MIVEVFVRGTNPAFSEHIETFHDAILLEHDCGLMYLICFTLNGDIKHSFDPDRVEFKVTA